MNTAAIAAGFGAILYRRNNDTIELLKQEPVENFEERVVLYTFVEFDGPDWIDWVVTTVDSKLRPDAERLESEQYYATLVEKPVDIVKPVVKRERKKVGPQTISEARAILEANNRKRKDKKNVR